MLLLSRRVDTGRVIGGGIGRIDVGRVCVLCTKEVHVSERLLWYLSKISALITKAKSLQRTPKGCLDPSLLSQNCCARKQI